MVTSESQLAYVLDVVMETSDFSFFHFCNSMNIQEI